MGHLVLAREAADQLDLEQVLIIPVGEAPHRRIDAEPGPDVRLEMVTAATAGDDVLRPSRIEIEREGPSYTFRTLELLHEERPSDEFNLILGADAAAGLGSWREPQALLERAAVAVAGRPGTTLERALDALANLGAEPAAVIAMPELDISSSGLRRRVGSGRSIRYLTPDPVRTLIADRGLYL
ncbi:MAG: nicotinate (nicotinamide) nucleotide adenylyltransferase [Actinomycetota bacterium]|nr:nicotinate (nicotinamide) nucleotide adenylyltransferase [Actinomycetota bacterium]